MNDAVRSIPDGILIVENFLDKNSIQSLRHYSDGQIGVASRVEAPLKDGRIAVERIDGFSSDYISVVEIESFVKSIFNRVFGEVIPSHYREKIEWYEYPHILRYRKGGNYKPHADADNWVQATNSWRRDLDRDYSAIIYFNHEFEGGSLYFPLLDYRIDPKPGMLVCFPSDGNFAHTAEPVTSGNRYALVSWAAAFGSERIRDKPENNVFYLKEQ